MVKKMTEKEIEEYLKSKFSFMRLLSTFVSTAMGFLWVGIMFVGSIALFIWLVKLLIGLFI